MRRQRLIFAFVLGFALAIVSRADAFPNVPPYNNFGASILGNANATNTATGIPASFNFVTLRFTARTLWTGTGTYNFTTLNSALANASTNSKKVVLDIEFGVNIPDSEINSLAALTPSGMFSTTWAFNLPTVQNGSTLVPCNTIQIPIPYNSQYLTDVGALITATATDIACTGTATSTCAGTNYTSLISGVVNTIDGYNDDESCAPAATSSSQVSCPGGGNGTSSASNAQCVAACNANSCACGGANPTTLLNDTSNWVSLGYTPHQMAVAMATVDADYHAAFPNAQIHHMILRNRFPGINDSSVATGAADFLNTPHEIMQYAGSRLPSGYCEVQVNNAMPSFANMSDAVAVAANTGCVVGFQSNGNSVNLSEDNFRNTGNEVINLGGHFMEWYIGEASGGYSTLGWNVNQLNNAQPLVKPSSGDAR